MFLEKLNIDVFVSFREVYKLKKTKIISHEYIFFNVIQCRRPYIVLLQCRDTAVYSVQTPWEMTPIDILFTTSVIFTKFLVLGNLNMSFLRTIFVDFMTKSSILKFFLNIFISHFRLNLKQCAVPWILDGDALFQGSPNSY